MAWEVRKLGEVYDVRDGTHDSPKYIKNGFALITSKNLKNDSINFENLNFISEHDYININKRSKVDVGDVLFAMIGTIGNPIVINSEPDFAIKNVALFKVPKEQNSYYLKYYLDSNIVINKMLEDAKGTTQKFVGLGYLRNFEIPIPPLAEQKRIVAILDEAFTAISTAKENAEKNLKNAKELFESYLNNIFEKKGKDWEEKKLGEVGVIFSGYGFDSKSFLKSGKYQVIRMGNVRPGLIRKEENPVFLNVVDEKIACKALLQRNDIIITQTGTRKKRDYGFTVAIDDVNYLLNQRLAGIRFDKTNNYKFYLYFTWTEKFRDQFFENETGMVGQGNVGIGAITGAIVPAPPLKEQQRIVSKLDALSEQTKKLESVYSKKIADLDELKKSILQKAFRGEL